MPPNGFLAPPSHSNKDHKGHEDEIFQQEVTEQTQDVQNLLREDRNLIALLPPFPPVETVCVGKPG